MMLAVLSAAAQEESHTKSEIMNISIEQRFPGAYFLHQNYWDMMWMRMVIW